MIERLSMQQIHDLKFLPMRCGLCDRVVREKSWEGHIKSKEHLFRLNLLKDEIEKKRKTYHNDELRWGDHEVMAVRNGANNPIKVEFT